MLTDSENPQATDGDVSPIDALLVINGLNEAAGKTVPEAGLRSDGELVQACWPKGWVVNGLDGKGAEAGIIGVLVDARPGVVWSVTVKDVFVTSVSAGSAAGGVSDQKGEQGAFLDFAAGDGGDPVAIALLLPAVQAVREAARRAEAEEETDMFRFALVDVDGDGDADAAAVWKAPANAKEGEGGETPGWVVFEGNDENVVVFTIIDDLWH